MNDLSIFLGRRHFIWRACTYMYGTYHVRFGITRKQAQRRLEAAIYDMQPYD